MKNKIFISDLHLGDGSKTDDFHKDAELLGFLDYVEKTDAELVLLGDIYELWQGHLDKIMWAHKEVCGKLFRLFPRRVYGNHDYLPFSKYWQEGYYNVEQGIFAQHGHQYDMFNKYKNPLFALKWPIGKYITVLIAELERWLHKDADVWFEKMINRYGKFLCDAAIIQNKAYKWPEQLPDLERNIYLHLNSKNFLRHKIIIMGHTHHANLDWLYGGGIYANCGAWVDNVRPTYICVTEETVQLWDWLDHKIIRELSIKK